MFVGRSFRKGGLGGGQVLQFRLDRFPRHFFGQENAASGRILVPAFRDGDRAGGGGVAQGIAPTGQEFSLGKTDPRIGNLGLAGLGFLPDVNLDLGNGRADPFGDQDQLRLVGQAEIGGGGQLGPQNDILRQLGALEDVLDIDGAGNAVQPGKGIVVGQLVLVRPAQFGGAIFDLGQPNGAGPIHVGQEKDLAGQAAVAVGQQNIDGAAAGQVGCEYDLALEIGGDRTAVEEIDAGAGFDPTIWRGMINARLDFLILVRFGDKAMPGIDLADGLPSALMRAGIDEHRVGRGVGGQFAQSREWQDRGEGLSDHDRDRESREG